MDIEKKIITAAECTFDRYGFTASGMDRLTDAADVSSRTLYKHVGNKTNLMALALARRRHRFFVTLDVDSVDHLFARLADWTKAEGARGCLFLRALGDTGGANDAVAAEVTEYREELRRLVTRLVETDTGHTEAANAVLILVEGAVTVASYRGVKAFDIARQAAATLIKSSKQ